MGDDQAYVQRQSRQHRKNNIVILSDRLQENNRTLPLSSTTNDKVAKGEKKISKKPVKPLDKQTSIKSSKISKKRAKDNDYLLEAIHNLKLRIKKSWKFATCFMQNCYPGLRTLEYYRKIRHHHKCECTHRTKKSKKRKESSGISKRRHQGVITAQQKAITSSLVDEPKNKNTQLVMADKTLRDIGGIFIDKKNGIPKPQEVHLVLEPPTYVPSTDDTITAYSEDIGSYPDGGWLGYMKNVFQTFALFLHDDDGGFLSSVFFKWACFLSVPVVFLLRTHYLFLRRKYEDLSGKLETVQNENKHLKLECGNLERAFSSRLLTMPSPSRDTLKRINSDLKVISENTLKLKNELNQTSASKMQLIKELENADIFLTNLKKKYSSITKKTK